MSEFGDRPEKVLAAFGRLDPKGKGALSARRVATLLTMFKESKDTHLTAEELAELLQETVDGNVDAMLDYRSFVKDNIFGAVK